MKKTLLFLMVAAAAACLPFPLAAQDASAGTADEYGPGAGSGNEPPLQYHVVVTANRGETPRQELGSSVTVITARQLERMPGGTVLDALRAAPELDVAQTGGAGGQASVFIRGAKSEHTLVLLDGVEINDPSTPGRAADLANLSLANVERIEIIRGPQSVLYGTDAMGGVIQIISKRGRGKLNGFVAGGAGSFNSFSGSAGLSHGSDRVHFSLGAARTDTDGISAASADLGNAEKDGFAATTVTGRLGVEAAKNLQADLVLRYVDSRADLDNSGGAGGDDPNNSAAAQQLFTRFQARLALFSGRWEQTAGVAFGRQDRRYRNDADESHPFDSDRGSYLANLLRFDWQHRLRFIRNHAMTAGIESELEKGESEYHSESAWGPFDSVFTPQTARTIAAYFQDHARLAEGWFATLGARLDDHDRFGSRATYRLATSYQIRGSGTRLKATYGTGFKAPSLYQLYSPYGDEALEPESSSGWDAGVEQPLLDERLLLGAVFFASRFRRMIDFDSAAWTYVNIGAARTRGIELSASAYAGRSLTLRAGYVWTEAEDEASGEALPRRARHKANASLSWRPAGKFDAGLDVHYVGRRQDMNYSAWPAARVTLDDYLLVNLTLEYEPLRGLRLLAALRNLGDARYEEVFGYGTPGRSFHAGLRFAF